MLMVNHLIGFGGGGAALPDPYRSFVVLLAQPTGADTGFVDYGPTPQTITASGAPTLSTTSPWGGKSIATSSGNFVYLADSSDWLWPANWAIEVVVAVNNQPPSGADYTLNGPYNAPSNERGTWFRYHNVGGTTKLSFFATNGPGSATYADVSVNFAMTTSTFYYLAAVGSGSNINIFGGPAGSGTIPRLIQGSTSQNFYDAAANLTIGALQPGTGPADALFAAVRVSKGTDRGYTGTTIENVSAPFPTF